MGAGGGDRLWQSRSSQHLFSRPQLVCWRAARGPPTWACRVQAYKLPNAGRVAVVMSLTTFIQNCDRPTASVLIRAILIRPSPITIWDRCGPGRITGATFNSARAKPRRRSKHRCRSSPSDALARWKVVSTIRRNVAICYKSSGDRRVSSAYSDSPDAKSFLFRAAKKRWPSGGRAARLSPYAFL